MKSFAPSFARARRQTRRPVPSPEQLESRCLLAGNVYTFHNDLAATGVNRAETQLTPGNVNVAQFGKHWSTPVDGQIYAQPLYVSGQNITAGSNPGTHNVAYVATEHDSVYAIDGDAGNVLWRASLLGSNESPVPAADLNTNDLVPEVGVTGTPVIDPATDTLYVAAKSKADVGGVPHYYFRLHALSLSSGAEKFGGPVLIGDTGFDGTTYTYADPLNHPYVRGTGFGKITVNINGTDTRIVPFNALRAHQRPGLSLRNGEVYLAFASHGDNGPYHGWVLRYRVPTTNDSSGRMTLNGVLNTTPNGGLGGIWQSGGSLAFDPQGNFYFETGNGTFTNTSTNFSASGFPIDANYGDSFLKVANDPTSTVANQNPNGWGLKVVDYFTPFNEPDLDHADTDLGSGGPLVLPDSVGSAAHPHLLVGAGKEGKIYLLDRDDLGKYDPLTDHVVQEQAGAVNGSLGVPAFFNNTIYYVGGYGDKAKTFSIGNGAFGTMPTSTSVNNFSFPGSTPSITANGSTNGVVWTLDRGTNQLRAYSAAGFDQLLWTSAQAANSRDQLGTVVKFTVPTAVDGKVFVGTAGALVSYGPPVPPATAPAAPTNLTATARLATEIDLAWQDVAINEALYHVERSLDGRTGWQEIGTAGVNATSFIDSSVAAVTHYYYRVRASNGLGNSAYSNTADATTAAATPLGAGDGLKGEYFDNIDFTGPGFTRVDPTVNFNWGSGSPGPGIDVNTFSVRWTGQVQAQFTGTYTFYTQSDDGVRLWVNNQLIIDNFINHASTENSGTISLAAGQAYAIRMDYFESGSNAVAQLRWSGAQTAKQVIPTSQLFSGVAPATPSNLTAVAASATQVNLSWRDGSNNESGFKIERKLGTNGTWAQVAQVGPNITGYMDSALNAAATYVYRVRAANFGSDSGYSNEATVTLPVAPATPSGARVSDVTTTTLKLSWQDNAGNEDGWRLWRKRSDTDTFIILANLPRDATSYDDANLSPGIEYDYHVQAYNVAGYSDFAGVTVATVTNPPTGLTATPGAGGVALRWTAPTGAETYTVYRSTTPGGPRTALRRDVTATTFTDTTAPSDATAYYVVTATDSGGESAASNEASVLPIPPAGPRVTEVLVAGSSWAPEFLTRLAADGLGDGGFALRGDAPPAVPWTNANQIKLRFDRDVVVTRNDLSVRGALVPGYGFSDFAYSASTHTATWTLSQAPSADKLLLDLAVAVHDASGAPLEAGEFKARFDGLAGDVTQDRAVNAVDLSVVRSRQLTTTAGTAPSAYGVFFDANGDGRINAVDLGLVRANQLHALPGADPTSVPTEPLFSTARVSRSEGLAALLE